MLPSSRISAITYANNPFPIVHNADSRFIGAVIYVAARFIRRNHLAFPTLRYLSLSLSLENFLKITRRRSKKRNVLFLFPILFAPIMNLR